MLPTESRVGSMSKSVKITIGLLAVFISIAAYYLGAAAFTPAVLLACLSAPMAIASILIKVWRLGILALYFSVFAVLTSPTFGLSPLTSDSVFLKVACVGLALAVVLWFSWRRSTKAT